MCTFYTLTRHFYISLIISQLKVESMLFGKLFICVLIVLVKFRGSLAFLFFDINWRDDICEQAEGCPVFLEVPSVEVSVEYGRPETAEVWQGKEFV